MVPFVLLGFGFLGLLVGISSVLFGFLKRTPQPGQRALSGLLALLGLAGVGFAGFIGLVGAIALVGVTAFVEHGPVRSVEVLQAGSRPAGAVHAAERERWAGAYARSVEERARESYEGGRSEDRESYESKAAGLDPRWPLHVIVEFQGRVDVRRLERWLARETHGDVELVDRRPVLRDGEELVRLDFGVDVDEDELDDFLAQMQLCLPHVDVPEGLRIEIGRP